MERDSIHAVGDLVASVHEPWHKLRVDSVSGNRIIFLGNPISYLDIRYAKYDPTKITNASVV